MIGQILFEVPNFGEVLLEPFLYANGRQGIMYTTSKGTWNLTINPPGHKKNEFMYLKMYDEAEVVSQHLIKKTDMFIKLDKYVLGHNYATIVLLNEDYYEKN